MTAATKTATAAAAATHGTDNIAPNAENAPDSKLTTARTPFITLTIVLKIINAATTVPIIGAITFKPLAIDASPVPIISKMLEVAPKLTILAITSARIPLIVEITVQTV